MDSNSENNDLEKARALEEKLERLRNEERIIKRNIDEYHELLRSEPESKERLTRKIEDEDNELVRVKAEIEAVKAEFLEASYPGKNYYTYKKYHFKCKKCGWEGLGSETVVVGDVVNFEVIGCPKCRWLIEHIPFPTTNEVLKYGTAEDKERARGWIEKDKILSAKWEEQWEKFPDLKSPDQLPDIDADEIVISLREVRIGEATDKDDVWENKLLVFYWGEREIYRVPIWFEYYNSYLRWGEILKEKYGERLVDFEAEETVDLGGDSFSAFKKVREFRDSLSKGKK